jgi:hypothetical protein
MADFIGLVPRMYSELGLVILRYENEAYPGEEGNTGFILTLSHPTKEWLEFIKHSDGTVRIIDTDLGPQPWTVAELNLMAQFRAKLKTLHTAYGIVSFGSNAIE